MHAADERGQGGGRKTGFAHLPAPQVETGQRLIHLFLQFLVRLETPGISVLSSESHALRKQISRIECCGLFLQCSDLGRFASLF